ncbi:SH3 domain-containing protein [Antarcticimicrobium sediminis]|uniref:SH3 domain-containing protein n=1 Tax=Antarcticimicrobium sediminis TaxID=2546227 RepID=UPI00140543A1|nr:SH3 domain-containing protein [Antarcticimicrobium sediminis]
MILAWAFYELSGGVDFVPRGVRPPKPAPQASVAQPRPGSEMAGSEMPAPRLAPRQPRDTDPDSNTDADFGRFTAETQRAALKARQAARADRLAQVRNSLNQGIAIAPGKVGFGEAQGSIALTALEQGLAGFEETTPETVEEAVAAPVMTPAPAPDLRAVTGTRVNMRDGPGTIYPVVARLVMGHQVEVLSASGTGWLRLRTLPERQIGWVAASLVSKKTE